MVSFEEVNDFYVQRKLVKDIEQEITTFEVFATIRDNDDDSTQDIIDHFCRDYMHSTNIQNGDVCAVRIPSAMFTRIDINCCGNEFKKLKESGAHLIVNSYGRLNCLKTSIDNFNRFHVSNMSAISSVYPCYMSPDNQLLIGLRFTDHKKKGFRSFSCLAQNKNLMGGVFDLSEDFLNLQRIQSGTDSPKNRELFGYNEHHFAIYMCAGAKLIVEDNYFGSNDNKAETNCSLFQSGSVIIVSGQLFLQKYSDFVRNELTNKEEERFASIEWTEAMKSRIIRPECNLCSNLTEKRGLDQPNVNLVVFLGHNYSKYGSNCWRLSIDKSEKGLKGGRLIPPKGGRIVDIQEWNSGWIEIYWRHHFERIYERVVRKTGKSDDRPNKREVQIISGENPFYWEKKIIGVGDNFTSWTIELYDQDSETPGPPPFIEMHTDLVKSVVPFAPPLHPPIYLNNEYIYLPYKTCPVYLKNQFALIDQKVFAIKYHSEVYEHLWSEPIRVSMIEQSLDIGFRIGTDLRVYTKQNQIIGKKSLFYFEIYEQKIPRNVPKRRKSLDRTHTSNKFCNKL